MNPMNTKPFLSEMALLDSVSASLYVSLMEGRVRKHHASATAHTAEERDDFANGAEDIASLCYQAAMAWGIVRARVYNTSAAPEPSGG